MHRLLVDKIKFLRPFSGHSTSKRALIITQQDPISLSQAFPFFFYGRQIRSAIDLEIRELPLVRLLSDQHNYRSNVDFVFFQTWFDLLPQQMAHVVAKIKSNWPDAKLVYLDWFAPADLRYAEILNENVTAYIKKQRLSDLNDYNQPTIGHTNLTDYYNKRFALEAPQSNFPVPPTFFEKLLLGSGFEQSLEILRLTPRMLNSAERRIDIHCRIAAKGAPWYASMRNEALQAAKRLGEKHIVACEGMVSKRQYVSELFQSKICFSPFGYGEVCWRDFEAMAAGSLLFKPDMSHLKLAGDPFQPFETYVPVSWDLSDLGEKAAYYLDNKSERMRIVENAFIAMKKRQTGNNFIKENRSLWLKLGLGPATPRLADPTPI
jgi:hypothetical protein